MKHEDDSIVLSACFSVSVPGLWGLLICVHGTTDSCRWNSAGYVTIMDFMKAGKDNEAGKGPIPNKTITQIISMTSEESI